MTERAEVAARTPGLAEIEARLAAITPGPWKACGTEREPTVTNMIAQDPRSVRHQHGACSCGYVWSKPDDVPVLEVIGGTWGDRWPAVRILDDGQMEAYMAKCDYGEVSRERQAANMKFAEHAPTDIATLLATVAALRKALEGTEAFVDKLIVHWGDTNVINNNTPIFLRQIRDEIRAALALRDPAP